MVGSKLIIYGGSDGTECFQDVWIFDVDTEIWKAVPVGVAPAAVAAAAAAAAGGQAPPKNYPRLSHTATIVGSYLFVVGGHDGLEYSSDVLSLNLGESCKPPRRGGKY